MFCRQDIVNRESIDARDARNYLPLNQIWLGPGICSLFQRQEIWKTPNQIPDVRARCMQFLVVLCSKIIKRFPVNDRFWSQTSALNPAKAIDPNLRVTMPSLNELAEFVPRLSVDVGALTEEWRQLPWHVFL